jgi:glycosyltransferase involved in cell wall biosynthesis
MIVDVVIPALNEEGAIGKVIADLPSALIRHTVVVDNGSQDATAEVARKAGAVVLLEPNRGYGVACLKGMDYLKKLPSQPDVLVFLDGDYSDHPAELPLLLDPIIVRGADLVIGSRVASAKNNGGLTPQQVFGNALATWLLRLIYGYQFTDLGPFRAIKWSALEHLQMRDRNYGWTVEMQIKAAKQHLKCEEVPVNYRDRIGKSKVSGTLKGTILAGYKILFTLFRYA